MAPKTVKNKRFSLQNPGFFMFLEKKLRRWRLKCLKCSSGSAEALKGGLQEFGIPFWQRIFEVLPESSAEHEQMLSLSLLFEKKM